jgi:hypothetical protein
METVADAEDATSQTNYGLRVMTLDLPWVQDLNTAMDFANYLRGWMKDPVQTPIITMEDQFANQFGYDLFARINYNSAKQGIDADFFVGKIEHEWRQSTGQGVRTTWYLEPVDMTGYWEFPTQLGVTSRLAY